MLRMVWPTFGLVGRTQNSPAFVLRTLLSHDWTRTAIPAITARTFSDDKKDLSKRLEDQMRKKRASRENLEAEGHTIEKYLEETDREFQEVTVKMFDTLIKNESDKKTIEGVLTDYEYLKYTTDRVPVKITVPQMERLMKETDTFISRTRFFDYLFQVEFKKIANKRRKDRIGALHQLKIAQEENYPTGLLFNSDRKPIYRKWHNSLFMRVTDAQMKVACDWAKCRAAMFNHKICFDVGFEEHMTPREVTNLADQLCDSYGYNQMKKEPMDITICNYPRERTKFVDAFEKRMPNLYFPNSFVTVSHESYLELFDRKKIIYLTPDTTNNLEDWDTDEVIVVGGIVDLGNMKPLTRTKAKKQGLRMARLPLDKHVAWGGHKKVLPLNQVLGILCDYQVMKDWRQAIIANVSARKLKTKEEIEEEENYRRKKLQFQRKNFFNVEDQQSRYPKDNYGRNQDYRNSDQASYGSKNQERRKNIKYLIDDNGNLDVQNSNRENRSGSRGNDCGNESNKPVYVNSYDFKGKFGKNKKDDN